MSSNTFKDNSSALGNPHSPSCSFLFTWGLASPQGMHTRKRWPTPKACLSRRISFNKTVLFLRTECQDCFLGGRPCACVAFAFGRRCSSLSYHIYSQRRLSARRLRLFLVVLDNQRELVSSLSEFLLGHLRAKGSALWIGGVESR